MKKLLSIAIIFCSLSVKGQDPYDPADSIYYYIHTTHVRVIINGDTLFSDKQCDFLKNGTLFTKIPTETGRADRIALATSSLPNKKEWFCYDVPSKRWAYKIIVDFKRKEVVYWDFRDDKKTEIMYYVNRVSELAIN